MNTTILSSKGILKRIPCRLLLPLLFTSWFVPWASTYRPQGEEEFARLRLKMVERDLRARGIKDERVLAAMSAIPRHQFVDESQRNLAYSDGPRPIGAGQTISQPYIVALMTELLELKGHEKVLEIGTGSGYQAAVLSHVAREVYTIEIIPALAAKAKETLAQLGYENILVRVGDGFYGWKENAPFDAILLTAAAKDIPARLWSQLREGGRIVMPLGEPRVTQKLVRVTKVQGKQQMEEIAGVIFVPMTGAVQEKTD